MRLMVTIASASILVGCFSLPDGFSPGHRSIHPAFGVSIANETADHFDVEVIVYGPISTLPDIDDARRVFLEVVRRYANNHGIVAKPVPKAELAATVIRNTMVGGTAIRIGKRVYIEN